MMAVRIPHDSPMPIIIGLTSKDYQARVRQESLTLEKVNLAMREKSLMVTVGQELLEIAKPDDYEAKIDELAFGKKGLEFVQHLSNLAGFCDNNTQVKIGISINYLTAMIVGPNELFAKTQLKLILPLAIGMRVDFNKKPPFRAIGFVKALGAQLKAFAKR